MASASALDAESRTFRDDFHVPSHAGKPVVYLCGTYSRRLRTGGRRAG
jgi:hypothetical protein